MQESYNEPFDAKYDAKYDQPYDAAGQTKNGGERSLGNGHLGLDNSRTLIMSARERDIGLHETDF